MQVYLLADALGVPQAIRRRVPTSDTYSAGSSQEEFFFRVPFSVLDPIWAGWERGLAAEAIAGAVGLPAEQVQRVIDDVLRKKGTTEYLRTAPVVHAQGIAGESR
jgi:NAD+ synthase